MTSTRQPFFIRAGNTTSDAISVEERGFFLLETSALLTGTSFAIHHRRDDGTFGPILDDTGAAVSIVVAPDDIISLSTDLAAKAVSASAQIKFVSNATETADRPMFLTMESRDLTRHGAGVQTLVPTSILDQIIRLLGPDGYLWIDDGSELVDAVAVTNWTDLIQGEVATEGTPANRPTAEANASTGRVAVSFDGTNDKLSTAPFTAIPQPYTVFDLVETVTLSNGARRWTDTGATEVEAFLSFPTAAISAGVALGSGTSETTGFSLYASIFNGASSIIRLNGVQTGSGNAGTNSLTGFEMAALDSTSFWEGRGHCYAIKAGIDPTEIAQIERLISRYHNGVALP